MTVDVYEDHIRFLGYHVPVDMSKLPPTARDSLVHELQSGADAEDDGRGYGEEDLEQAAAEERGSILARVEKELDAKSATTETERLVQSAAKGCARLVLDNLKSLATETPEGLSGQLVRWFENDLRTHFVAAAEDAADAKLQAVRDLIEELDV